jgi:putative restriction endonuclease
MKKGETLWTREQVIMVINLYCKLPFGQYDKGNTEVKRFARLIGRTPSAVAKKLGNFSSLDPVHQARGVKGLHKRSALDEVIWAEYMADMENFPYQGEVLRAQLEGRTLEDATEIETADLPQEGKERIAMVKTRVNQGFFRKMVLTAYNHTCCITGLNIPSLLVAGHIRTWSADPANRMNPSNGLCLNALHDKAFEQGLIGIAPDYTIRIAAIAKKSKGAELLNAWDGKPLNLPKKFSPDPAFLQEHFSERFLG